MYRIISVRWQQLLEPVQIAWLYCTPAFIAPAMVEVLWSVRFACYCVILSVISRFHWNLVLWLVGPKSQKNWLTFRCDPVLDADSGSLSTSLTIVEYGILGDLLAFLIHSPADFHDFRRNDLHRKDNASTTRWELSGRHRNPYNPEIQIRILDLFRLRLDTLAEVCALWVQSTVLMCYKWNSCCVHVFRVGGFTLFLRALRSR